MAKYVCSICGYVAEGEAPEKCPVCGAGKDKFTMMAEGQKNYADEHRIGVAKDVDPEILEGLRANFMGECTEVGMYIAMARQADREGYPEIAEAFKRECEQFGILLPDDFVKVPEYEQMKLSLEVN